MSDQFEKFVNNNRDAFDDRTPPPSVWEKLENDLPEQQLPTLERKTPFIWKAMRIAAAVTLFLGLGFVIGRQSQNTANEVASERELMFQEIKEIEEGYKTQISDRLKKLASYEVAPQVTTDLKEMDKNIELLKEELSNIPPGKEKDIINAMMDNYRARLEILERVLNKLEPNIDQIQKSKNNESLDI